MELKKADKKFVEKILEQVTDPEIPVLSIRDLGILRDVQVDGDEVKVVITPTYSGCPAMHRIEDDIREILLRNGIPNVQIETVLSPPWTTAWLTEEGRKKLFEYGIAPPVEPSGDLRALKTGFPRIVICPLCKSQDTELKSPFGSTACKALYVCRSCKEPFDYFKCL